MSLAAHPLIRDWLTVSDGRIVLKSGKVDIGQRISTALTRIVAEELGLDPGEIGVAPVRTGYSPDEGITSGSNSIEQSGAALRAAAASLRRHLLATASERLDAERANLEIRDGLIVDSASNRSVRLVDLAATLDPGLPIDPDAPTIPVARRRPPATMPPRGLAEMVCGAFTYVHDLERPGMLHARTVRPPHAHARFRGTDPGVVEALEAQGIRLVRDGSFLAVAGVREYPTILAARRLACACDWDTGDGLAEGDVFAHLKQAPATSLPVVDGRPRDAALPAPLDDPTHAARFERPYQMHGALAPSAALAEWRDGRLTLHTHSQGIYPLRESIADSLALPLDRIELIHAPGSGCYGHNGADDAAFEAALVARALPDTPVLLKWTREDEHGWEPYAPAMAVEVAARLDPAGRVTAWSQEAWSATHRGRPRPSPDRAGPARLIANRLRAEPVPAPVAAPNMGVHAGLHRNLDPIYAVPERRLVKHLVQDAALRTSAMRSLGAAANVFAIESFMDELALEAGRDPLDFRRDHLSDARALAVLKALERAAGAAPGAGRGLAYAQYKNAMARVAVAVDLEVTDRAEVRLLRAVIAADAGRVLDPDGLRAQLEGGFLQAASWTLCEEVSFDRDGIRSTDWESYPVLRFDNVPEIEVVLLDAPEEKSLGAGEAACGPAIAAIANALFAATGLRLRRLPFTADAIRAQALG
ncbi:MAG: molybdopterin cofactor-binding domain-containing protein [Paracoccaceae bacterium]